ncbi:MAG: hypothetical protein HY832_03820, partial [Candidatus Aenigmarchaeota archaeon]|nr:hypothetical protein [Candidatus Aenigmarchaeota archaeon]
QKINASAEQEMQNLKQVHASKVAEIQSRHAAETQNKAEELKRSFLVPARLQAKKALLEEKQNIITKIYAEIQKEHKLSNAETARIREESEVKITQILFGEQND